MRIYKALALIASLGILFYVGRCTARSEGRDNEKAQQYKAQADAHRKAAEVWKDLAQKEKKRGDSLEKRKEVVRTKYVTLRDSLVITDTVQVVQVLNAADSVIEVQDSVIASKDRRIGFLELSLSQKDEQINALNRLVATQVRLVRNAKRDGWIKGVAGVGFGIILGVAGR